MNHKKTLLYLVENLKKKGADHVFCHLTDKYLYELSLEAGKINLLRTTQETSIAMSAILDHKKGSIKINKTDKESLDNAMNKVMEIAGSSKADPANKISEYQKTEDFSDGLTEPNPDLMYDKLTEFNETVQEKYPDTILEVSGIDFTTQQHLYLNSNDTYLNETKGYYSFGAMFTSKKDGKSSSFNYTDVTLDKIDHPLIRYGTVDTLLKQSTEQISTEKLNDKYTGDIIVTPDCLMSFFNFLIMNIRDHSLITGTSVYKDKLGKQIAQSMLTLHAHPRSDELVSKSFITDDGYHSQNITLIKDGILKTFLLSLYGAEKTGLERALNQGSHYIINPGDQTYDDLIKSVKKGILVCRFSSGQPGKSGDYSGVAKNSYRIKNGKVLNPVTETMISGNMADLLMNIKGISSERINFGNSIMPWVQFGNVNISG